jgi:hypothetical protein
MGWDWPDDLGYPRGANGDSVANFHVTSQPTEEASITSVKRVAMSTSHLDYAWHMREISVLSPGGRVPSRRVNLSASVGFGNRITAIRQ